MLLLLRARFSAQTGENLLQYKLIHVHGTKKKYPNTPVNTPVLGFILKIPV
jgi:hypothetical protein